MIMFLLTYSFYAAEDSGGDENVREPSACDGVVEETSLETVRNYIISFLMQ